MLVCSITSYLATFIWGAALGWLVTAGVVVYLWRRKKH